MWLAPQDLLLKKSFISKTYFQLPGPAPCGLLLPTLDAPGGAGSGQDRKAVEGFYKENAWHTEHELLGEVEENADELLTEEAGEIPNNLHLENN